MNKYLLALLILLIQPNLKAQSVLKLQDVFEIALQNNFSIRVAKNDAETNKNNKQIGNAGMLPSVLGTVNQDNQVVDSRQKFLSGTENNRKGAKSNSLNANVELGWTLFNGMKMFATRNRLIELENIGNLRLKLQIENTLSRVAKAYYDVVLNKQLIQSSNTFIQISQKRLEVAEAKLAAGKSSKSEVLLALVNLNSDRSQLIRLQTQYKNSKLSLNQLMAKELSFDFETEDSIKPEADIKLEDIRPKAMEMNTGLQISKSNQKANYLAYNEIRAERMPVVQLKTGYNFSNQTSQAGFLQSSNSSGFHYGAGLSMNLFNGFDVNRRINNAKLLMNSSELQYKDSLSKLEVAITQAYNTYSTNLELWKFEQNNLEVARQNFNIAMDQHNQGIISSNDLRIAQVNLVQNINRMLSSAYDAKLSEIELQRLSGGLIK